MTAPRQRSRSNRRVHKVTPGHHNVIHYRRANSKIKRCGISGEILSGLPRIRMGTIGRLSKSKKTINRKYGGTYSAKVVRKTLKQAIWTQK